MNIATIESAISDVVKEISPETFIYRLLAAYGKPKASITRLQKGDLNLSKHPGEVIWKKNLFFRALEGHGTPVVRSVANPNPSIVAEPMAQAWDLHALADRLRKSEDVSKHALRFIITTDWETLVAVDTKTGETLDIPIKNLHKHAHFFLPWAGQEKHKGHNESQADIKAAYKMGKLYDQVCADNPGMSAVDTHALNVFLSRLLFCFFAEDTEIFPVEGMFTSSIASHTQQDGSDLNSYLDKLFDAMNTNDRSTYPAYLQAFPYVNGGLLSRKLNAPTFSRYSRKIILECGDLDWSEINPDIFGSMMQAVVHTEHRAGLGMHYTSVTNIMKVIEPLFLTSLRNELEEHYENAKGLERLLQRLYNIRVFDPACGSGNFLIIAYKELRNLEMQIYHRLREIHVKGALFFPRIRLGQFYGIELDDFAHEIAMLSLWLAEHQMNMKFKEEFGQLVDPLPLKESGHIVCGNAARLDWTNACPKDPGIEIYILGNPPYNGSKKQTFVQKEDMAIVFENAPVYKSLDYISAWFIKASHYIENTKHKFAFVSTSSLTQGDQVALFWPLILQCNQQIFFAHKTFIWGNNAKKAAGVDCVIVGMRETSANKDKFIFDAGHKIHAENINPYLVDATNILVGKRNEPLSKLPAMVYGNMPLEGGFLNLTPQEKDFLLKENTEAGKFLRRVTGGDEFLASIERWCLWIEDEQLNEALLINGIRNRIAKVREFRTNGGDVARTLVERSHQFRYRKKAQNVSIILPCTSSWRRDYLQCGFFSRDYIVNHSAQVIYDPDPYLFAVLSSKMHMVWTKMVAGRLRNDIRYSNILCYNTFPVPDLTDKQRETLSSHVFDVLGEREKHPEKTTADLYDPERMPKGLLHAHRDLDVAFEKCYRSKPFATDEERLEYLFKLYQEMRDA